MELDYLLRFLCAFVVGSLLSLGGSLTQIFTQNELAAPSSLGLDSLIVLQILIVHLILSFFHLPFSLEWSSFVLSIVVLLVTLYYWPKKKSSYSQQFILVGMCINLFIGALFSLVYFLFLTKSLEFPAQIWFGQFKQTSWSQFSVTFMVATFCYALLYQHLAKLQLFVYGEDFCQNLKINQNDYAKPLITCIYLGVGVSTCFFGVFSFLGLLFPHLLRGLPYFNKNITAQLIHGSFLCGLCFAFIDYLVYEFPFYGAEIPVGMISSFIGSFLFLIILVRKNIN